MSNLSPYQCPRTGSKLTRVAEGLKNESGQIFKVLHDGKIPAFSYQEENLNEYSINLAAEVHDNALEWLLETHNTTEDIFRHEVLSNLGLTEGQCVLITGVGAGNDLPYVCSKIGKKGKIYCQDFSQQMLFAAYDRCQNKFGLHEYDISFSLSDAVNLPFEDNYFDVVYHFGGINIFSDIAKGVSEMERVVKKSGRVVFGDEGLAPWLRKTEIGAILITNNPLYQYQIPLEFLPQSAVDVRVNWTINNCYYVVSYTSTKEDLPVNLDLPHKGTRGGSLRKRHYGVLEGVDPTLKEEIYKQAKINGKSRVEHLEDILKNSLNKGC